MSASSPPAAPRRWRAQFSLRMALLALTAFGIGFPVWYRWPYEEVVARPPGVFTITTWQRQWGGGKLKHGPEREVFNGNTLRVTTFKNGKKNGPYADYRLSTGPGSPRYSQLADNHWSVRR